ncbi:MAG: class I SAM-dependent methyltransferase, partial [Planctomycetota bacterium]
ASADLVVLFGVMHHVPTFERRRALLQRALARVAGGGRLVVCFWQFAPEGEPRVAVAPWAEAGIEPSDVDPGDFLVRWRRGGQGLRYCHHCSPADIDALVAQLDADTVDHFKSDGASADLNMYVTLRPKHSRKP